jgi:polyphosphate kinase 2 (PPK2 family)
VFNRSHYEDVLVVRVNELVPRSAWEDRYQRINDFERHLAASGVVIVKFFLHISREEQRVRLIERLDDPRKNWKFNAGDLAERARWDAYTEAYEAALARCSTVEAPWYVVPADRNTVRNVLVARTVLAALERLEPAFPPATPEALELRATIR